MRYLAPPLAPVLPGTVLVSDDNFSVIDTCRGCVPVHMHIYACEACS